MIYEIKTVDGVKTKVPLTGNGYGLPLGTWISYEGTCPDGFIESEQTFNTTTYAALYALLGSNKVPARFDHSRLGDYEAITISSDANNPTVMPYDGILVISARGGAKEVYCNGKVLAGVTTGTPIDNTTSFLFNKDDELYVINPYADTIYVAYYKRHLAIKATPAYVEPDTVSDMVNTLRTQDSYSLEEVNTGKKWVDGKPIYRKCFRRIEEGGNWDNVPIASGIDTITKVEGTAVREGSYVLNLPSVFGSPTWQISIVVNIVQNGVWTFVVSGWNISRISNICVTIEYTKTTD